MMYVKENGRIIVTKNAAREITENAAFLFTVYIYFNTLFNSLSSLV